ncbi:MAG: sulfurtransferase TusA family protein [Hyphomicrobiales bacterium]|nr:sulfurtransferase TusA family protein [Hyphomicrobiales bacterium]
MSMPTQILDTSGLNCPLPILKTKKALKSMAAGETLQLLATDPGSVADIAAFCKQTGNDLIESAEEDGTYRFLIKNNP